MTSSCFTEINTMKEKSNVYASHENLYSNLMLSHRFYLMPVTQSFILDFLKTDSKGRTFYYNFSQ